MLNETSRTAVENLPLTKCRNCGCGFQGQAGDHDKKLCNICCMAVAEVAVYRLTSAIPYFTYPKQYEHLKDGDIAAHEKLLKILELLRDYRKNPRAK